MKNRLQAMSLSLILSAPITLGQIALAQVHEEPITPINCVQPTYPGAEFSAGWADKHLALEDDDLRVSQDSELQAFGYSGYTADDATVLANFWGESFSDAKSRIGRKIMWGGTNKAVLELMLVEAQDKALNDVEALNLYADSGFTYDDAQAVAEYWGDATPYDGKLRIERALILGHRDAVRALVDSSKNP